MVDKKPSVLRLNSGAYVKSSEAVAFSGEEGVEGTNIFLIWYENALPSPNTLAAVKSIFQQAGNDLIPMKNSEGVQFWVNPQFKNQVSDTLTPVER